MRTPVGPLPIQRGGIVEVEEGIEEFVVTDLLTIEVDFDNFSVAGLVGADVLVSGSGEGSALIANGSRGDSRDGGERSFNAPETSCSKCRFFDLHTGLDARGSSPVTKRRGQSSGFTFPRAILGARGSGPTAWRPRRDTAEVLRAVRVRSGNDARGRCKSC